MFDYLFLKELKWHKDWFKLSSLNVTLIALSVRQTVVDKHACFVGKWASYTLCFAFMSLLFLFAHVSVQPEWRLFFFFFLTLLSRSPICRQVKCFKKHDVPFCGLTSVLLLFDDCWWAICGRVTLLCYTCLLLQHQSQVGFFCLFFDLYSF